MPPYPLHAIFDFIFDSNIDTFQILTCDEPVERVIATCVAGLPGWGPMGHGAAQSRYAHSRAFYEKIKDTSDMSYTHEKGIIHVL